MAKHRNDDNSERSNKWTVLQSIKDLCEADKPANRAAVHAATGIPIVLVESHLKALRTDGMIFTPPNSSPGYYYPVTSFPERAVSVTMVPGWSELPVKLELGDKILELTYKEGRSIAALLAGLLLQFGNNR